MRGMKNRISNRLKRTVINVTGLISLMVCCCFVTACKQRTPVAPPSSSLSADVLATVEGRAILVSDFQAELERRLRGRAERSADIQAKEDLLESLVNAEAVYTRARQAGFDQRADISRQIKEFIVQRFIEEGLQDSSTVPVSDTQIAEYYRDNATSFATPAKIRFAIIEFRYSTKATDAKKQEVLQRASAILADAASSKASELTFGALAQRHSEDQATRYAGGDAGWVSRDESTRWPSTVIEAAFALDKPGGLAPVIATSNAFYLMKLLERKEASRRPLEEVAEAIRYQLAIRNRHQVQDTFYKAAKADLKIEINHALLDLIPVPASGPVSSIPALPGS